MRAATNVAVSYYEQLSVGKEPDNESPLGSSRRTPCLTIAAHLALVVIHNLIYYVKIANSLEVIINLVESTSRD